MPDWFGLWLLSSLAIVGAVGVGLFARPTARRAFDFVRAHPLGVTWTIASVALVVAFPKVSALTLLVAVPGGAIIAQRAHRNRRVRRGKAMPRALEKTYTRAAADVQPIPVEHRPDAVPFYGEAMRVQANWNRVCAAVGLFVPDYEGSESLHHASALENGTTTGMTAVLEVLAAQRARQELGARPDLVIFGNRVVRVPVIRTARPGAVGPIFTVELPPGISLDDVGRQVVRLRAGLDVPEINLYPHGTSSALIEVEAQFVDPFADLVLSTDQSGGPLAPIRIGRDRLAAPITWDPTEAAHIAIQGATRSGKSALIYGMVSALVRKAAVMLAGIDPSRVLLTPWTDQPHPELRCVGDDPVAACQVLSSLVDLMTSRLDDLVTEGLDKFDIFTEARPLVVILLEEYPGLLEAAAAHDAGEKPADRVAPRIKGHVARLLRESAKVGFRVVLIAQRMDADIVGGASRSQLGLRVTLRVDNGDGVRMLHEHATSEQIAEVPTFPPGRALVQAPGVPLTAAQMDLTDYATYKARVLGT